jgi:hypothetical protein
MTTLMFTRPVQWKHNDTPFLNLVHAPVFGPKPMLRGGAPMGDSVGGCTTDEGLTKMVNLFKQHKPDAFLFWAMYGMSDTDKHQLASVQIALATCKRIAPKCKFFYGNGNQASTILKGEPDFNVLAFKSVIDVVLDNTRDKRIHDCYKKHGLNVDVLHTFGFDPAKFPTAFDVKPEYDAYFGGSYTGHTRFPNSGFRHDLLTRIDKEFNLLVSGRGRWPVKHVEHYQHAVDYPKMFARAKVAIGCYHDDLQQYYTKRSIYALASGRPYLVRYIPGMEDDFQQGKHLVMYTDVTDAVQLLKQLIENPKTAKKIGKAGREIAVDKHSWNARLIDMAGVLGRWL